MQNSKKDGETKSSSSCFSKGGDANSFNMTDEGHRYPPQIPVGSSAKWCWCQILMGLMLQDTGPTYTGSCTQTLLEFG